MSETSKKMRGNVERVLRAMDVIPPFGEGPPGDGVDAELASDERAKPRIRPWSRPQEQDAAPEKADPPQSFDDAIDPIPTLDLGEKILAEQRRMTARKRKAPGVAPSDDNAVCRPPVIAMRTERAVEPLAQDVVQLQQLVAEIVARDIECLCAGPARMTP